MVDGCFERVDEGNYGSTSEYVRDLIRRDPDRRLLRNALVEGARSPLTTNADAADIDGDGLATGPDTHVRNSGFGVDSGPRGPRLIRPRRTPRPWEGFTSAETHQT